jgi:thiamine biosynthesis protein ThiS
VRIKLNGETYDVDEAATVSELLVRLDIDPRRVAVERNLAVLKRGTFDTTRLADGDEIEIVNFVGGG